MKRDFLILLVLLLCVIGTNAWGFCPQDTLDRGNCDTLYIEPWADDIADSAWQRSGVHIVKVPIYVTADIIAPYDSINAFVIPLCYTHSNPSKYCSVTAYLNNSIASQICSNARSIFHDLPSNSDPLVLNWMKAVCDVGLGEEWNSITLDLDGTSHFWLSMIPTGSEDQRFISGNKILIATMTMKLEDTMHVCVDTCFWPPSSSLVFGVYNQDGFGSSKIPRSGTGTSSFQICFPPRDTSDVKEIEGDNIKPTDFSLSQNYPNPFNPTTNFQFTLPKSSHVKIEIFNIVGQKVATLVDGDMKAGVYNADWNGRDESGKTVSSGIYFYRMQAGDFSNMKKMVLIK